MLLAQLIDDDRVLARFLKRKGFVIVGRQVSDRLGEIDLIARDKDTLVFVEVKARRSDTYGGPKPAVTWRKQRKISMVALQYLKTTGQLTTRARFDVVAVHPCAEGERVEVVKNAFDLAYF